PGLVSSVLLDAKEHIQYGWDIFQCFHKKRDFYWGKWGITKWFDDGIVMPWNAHDMGKYLNYVSESTPDYSASIVFGDAFTYAVNNVFIFCPVDAYLIDEKGDVVAAIINNEPVLYNEEDLAVQIAIAGDEKCISYPANRKYKLEMEATGSGTMGYVVAQGNPDDEMFSGCAIYQNISLTNGRKIRSIIDSEKVENSSIYGEDEDGSIQSDIQPNGTEIKHVHEWNSRYSVDESATCNKDGSESIHCSKCDAVKEGSERIIPAIGHNWGEWITTIAPTETAAGQQSRTCSVCGFTETQEIPQLTPSTQAVAPAASAVIVDLPAVKISKPSAGKKKITVKWKKVSKKNLKKISGIQIQVATDPNFTNIVKTATAGKKKTSKIIKGLSSKTKYYVRIRAYAAENHVSAWKVKSVKVK
ncbi:MAG: hypothetical protein IJI11_07705, partial [Mogibacterium sp.]|nr:hypothetical protein [Mogibacterium sp.]